MTKPTQGTAGHGDTPAQELRRLARESGRMAWWTPEMDDFLRHGRVRDSAHRARLLAAANRAWWTDSSRASTWTGWLARAALYGTEDYLPLARHIASELREGGGRITGGAKHD